MRILNTYYEDVPPSNVLTPEEILDLCCKPTSVDECSEVGKVTPYEGADQSDIDKDAALEQARADNPGKRILSVQIEDVGRPGKPCGEQHETWQDRLNCCDEATPMSFDKEATPDVLPHDSSIIVYAEGGIPPYTFRTTSHATSFPDGRRTWTTLYPVVELSAGETFCGGTQIEVTDGCSTAIISVRSDLGHWEYNGIGCELAGMVGTLIGISSGQRIMEAIWGNTKVLDYQVNANSYEMGTYLGGDVAYGGEPSGCPSFGGASCDMGGLSHCTCAAMAGVPVFDRGLCLAANTVDIGEVVEYCGDPSSWLKYGGFASFSCNSGHNSGAVIRVYRVWMGGGEGPYVYKWVC